MTRSERKLARKLAKEMLRNEEQIRLAKDIADKEERESVLELLYMQHDSIFNAMPEGTEW